MKKTLQYFFMGFCFLAVICLCVIPVRAAKADNPAKSGFTENGDLFLTFNDASDLDYFNAYISETGTGGSTVNMAEYWEVKDGVLVSKLNCVDTDTYANYSSLLLKDYGFICFELSVDISDVGDKTGYSAVLGRMRRPGVASYIEGVTGAYFGAGAYVSDGTAVMQQHIATMPSWRMNDKKVSQKEWYNIKLRFDGMYMTMWVDGQEIYKRRVDGDELLGGYIGLQAVNRNSKFDNFHLSFLNGSYEHAPITPSEDKIKIACLGDSLTFGSCATNEKGEFDMRLIYAGHLQRMLGKNVEVRNFGMGGRTAISDTGSCLADFPEYYFCKAFKADIVCIMLGTNDSAEYYWDEQKFIDGYSAIIDGIYAANPNVKIYLNTAPYMSMDMGILSDDLILRRSARVLPEIAKKYGLTIIDTYTDTLAAGAEHQPDGIHFDSYGYSLIANSVYKQIVKDSTEEPEYPESLTLGVGQTYDLGYKGYKPLFKSTAPARVTVDENGVLTGMEEGVSVIRITLGDKTKMVKVTVAKDNVEVADIRCDKELRYGDELPLLSCKATNNGAEIEGTLVLDAGQSIEVGEKEYMWTFTPSDPAIAPVTGKVTLTAQKGIPAVQTPVLENIVWTAGLKFSSLPLPTGFALKADGEIKEGKNIFTVVYTPEDLEHYESVELEVSVTAEKAKTSAGDKNEKKGCNGTISGGVGISAVIGVCLGKVFKKKKD